MRRCRRGGELRTARDTLAEDLEAIEASVRAWADRGVTLSAAREYTAAVADLPAVFSLSTELTLRRGAKQSWSRDLNVWLVRVDSEKPDAGQTDDLDESITNDIRVRLPRPVTLGLYVRDAAEEERWVLDQTFDVAVVDAKSRVTAIPLDIGEKADRTVTVSVGADGIPVQIGVMQGSGLNEMFSALGQVPAGLAAGATSAKDILASTGAAQVSAGSITDAALSRRISELEMNKKLIDAELTPPPPRALAH